jgi:C1A family cysteine protease
MLLSNRYSVRASRYDRRDRIYRPKLQPIRETVDLRPWASTIEDQQELGSCTGQAVAGAYELLLNKEYPDRFVDLSRLFVYYNARLIEGNVNEDQGAYVKDAIKATAEYGVCSEAIWPYRINQFNLVPTIASYEDAKKRKIKNYRKLTEFNDILDALNSNMPVVSAIQVYTSFDYLSRRNNYILETPSDSDNILGGHAVTLVGYDIPRQLVLIRNSFGPDWGVQGYFWATFDYVRNYFMDSWTFDIDLAL